MKSASHWQKIGLHAHHGISLPLFSLRSQRSCGIGEFTDLIPLIDWCKQLHLDCIQLLPLNDTGLDPSPYNSLSSCALHPIYLSLFALGLTDLSPFQKLNAQPRLLYREVLSLKMTYLRQHFRETFPALSLTSAYQNFLRESPWLEEYVHFKAYKERLSQVNWTDWPTPLPSLQQTDLDFHRYLQFHCFSQLQKVKAYASEQKIFLKGDLPILVSPDSADVWAQPTLFRREVSAGAPPDYYNPLGQNWGFPLFDWEAMRQDGYRWWKRRLQALEKLFHLYRIDHVVGFFRIWGIEKDKKPHEGAFYPADESLWAKQGQEHLERLLAMSSLLPIAEDLGTIPKLVYPILKELGICGTKVLRWQRNWETDQSYIPFDQYEPLSMTTVSTPDMCTLDLWWKSYPDEAIPLAHFKQWPYHPILTPAEHLEILRDAHHTASYFHINLLQEYLDLFPELSWRHPEEERINIPGTLLPTNWTFRFRPFLEEIVSHPQLAAAFGKILFE